MRFAATPSFYLRWSYFTFFVMQMRNKKEPTSRLGKAYNFKYLDQNKVFLNSYICWNVSNVGGETKYLFGATSLFLRLTNCMRQVDLFTEKGVNEQLKQRVENYSRYRNNNGYSYQFSLVVMQVVCLVLQLGVKIQFSIIFGFQFFYS